jgi:HEAT repeat protein
MDRGVEKQAAVLISAGLALAVAFVVELVWSQVAQRQAGLGLALPAAPTNSYDITQLKWGTSPTTVLESEDAAPDLSTAREDHSLTRTAESKTAMSASSGNASPEIVARLESANSSERAAALADLAKAGGDDSFHLITQSLDDPSTEVRNAAVRALCDLEADPSASFTRALREASTERRQRIGAAIAGSGIAANAINNLLGERRERTYEAFSMLFLMAKAGEIEPLLQAIAKHPNHEVRLIAVKLLALSNQPQTLAAFRSLAGRETLPPDVRTAVMEAIYLLSNQAQEVA